MRFGIKMPPSQRGTVKANACFLLLTQKVLLNHTCRDVDQVFLLDVYAQELHETGRWLLPNQDG